MNKKRILGWLADLGIMILGGVIWAVSINVFTLPNKIAAGGLSGLGTVFYYAFHIPVGVTIILFNIPIFIFAWKLLGREWFAKSLIAMLVTSVIIDLTAFLPEYTGDSMLAAVFGGVTSGIGLGLIYMRGIATGGIDLIARMIKKYVAVPSYGTIIILLDLVVIAISGIVFRDFAVMLYAVIVVYITGLINDKLLNGLDRAKLVYVISDSYAQIGEEIENRLKRGVTLLDGKGNYTGKKEQVIMVVVRPYEFFRLKALIRQVDPKAFVIVGDISEVLGNGFRSEE